MKWELQYNHVFNFSTYNIPKQKPKKSRIQNPLKLNDSFDTHGFGEYEYDDKNGVGGIRALQWVVCEDLVGGAIKYDTDCNPVD